MVETSKKKKGGLTDWLIDQFGEKNVLNREGKIKAEALKNAKKELAGKTDKKSKLRQKQVVSAMNARKNKKAWHHFYLNVQPVTTKEINNNKGVKSKPMELDIIRNKKTGNVIHLNYLPTKPATEGSHATKRAMKK